MQPRFLTYLRETYPQTQSSGIKSNTLNLILSIETEEQFEGRKHQEKTSTEKGNEKMGPHTKADKDDIYQKGDNKAGKRKKDFSKLPHFGKHGVGWLCGESETANNGSRRPFHKKAVSVNLTTVESLPVGDTSLYENSTPNVCHINVVGYNVRNDIPANMSRESLNTMSVVNSESRSDALRGVLDDSDFTKIIQLAELIDVYHPANDICQTDVFDDLSILGSAEPDLCLSGPDTVKKLLVRTLTFLRN